MELTLFTCVRLEHTRIRVDSLETRRKWCSLSRPTLSCKRHMSRHTRKWLCKCYIRRSRRIFVVPWTLLDSDYSNNRAWHNGESFRTKFLFLFTLSEKWKRLKKRKTLLLCSFCVIVKFSGWWVDEYVLFFQDITQMQRGALWTKRCVFYRHWVSSFMMKGKWILI